MSILGVGLLWTMLLISLFANGWLIGYRNELRKMKKPPLGHIPKPTLVGPNPDWETLDYEYEPPTNINQNKFGHHFAPIGAIRDAMPKLDDRHIWESWLDTSSGEPVFKIKLLETNVGAPDTTVSERSINLYREGITRYETWAEFYKSAPRQNPTPDDLATAKGMIINPTLEWMNRESFMIRKDQQGYEVRR